MTRDELRAAVDLLLDQVPKGAPYDVIVLAFDENGIGDAGSTLPAETIMSVLVSSFAGWAMKEGMTREETLAMVDKALSSQDDA